MASKHKEALFASLATKASLNEQDNDLAQRCKFNFSYFVPDDKAGQDFKDWNQDELAKLFNKIRLYTQSPLNYWQTQNVGRFKVFVNYGSFPTNTDFTEPKHIPIEVEWCRFHLENKPRLIGFVIPDSCHNEEQGSRGFRFDKNTFYVVFLDKEHKFYKTDK